MRLASAWLGILLLDQGPALALPTNAVALQEVGGVERIARGPAFDAADVVTRESISVTRPSFDASAGFFPPGGILTAEAWPQNLSGSYSVLPTSRESWSASVTTAESDGLADVSDSGASASVTAISASSTAARPGLADGGWGSGAAGSRLGAAASVPADRHLEPLTKSSVFVAERSDDGISASAGSGSLAALQGVSWLTVDQALRTTGAAGRTIEAYTVADPVASGSGTAVSRTVTLPMRINSISYGYLNSSLTVFSDEVGSFGGIGQSFNGLTALNIAEPASVAMLGAGLAGLAAIRRRRRGR